MDSAQLAKLAAVAGVSGAAVALLVARLLDGGARRAQASASEDKPEDKPEDKAELPSDAIYNDKVGADAVVIDHDLMCSICFRPDAEDCMLVCDCKAGYHTFCLTPPLSFVPEGDWQCPECAGA